jgi:hypothetical protein
VPDVPTSGAESIGGSISKVRADAGELDGRQQNRRLRTKPGLQKVGTEGMTSTLLAIAKAVDRKIAEAQAKKMSTQ